MERKSFFGLVIGALIGIVILFAMYWFFFRGTETGQHIKNSIGSFFPIGSDVAPDQNNVDEETQNDQNGTFVPPEIIIPKLRKLSDVPVSGYIAFDRATTTKTIVGTSTVKASTTVEMAVRYMEKSTGQIYETTDHSFSIKRLSNTTVGIFDQATFSNPQSFVARRFNEDTSVIDTYIGSLVKIGTSTDDMRTVGAYYPRNPNTMAVRGTSIFALYEYPLNADGYVTQTAPVKETKVFTSPLSGWDAEWINKDLLLLTTKPNAGYDGYAYSFNPTTKKRTALFGPIAGLTAKVNSTATAGLYAQSDNNGLSLFVSNFKNDKPLRLSSVTLPEKCVFSLKNPLIAYCAVPRPLPPGSYPEDWYKGKVQFDDAIVKIDLDKNIETPIVNLHDEGGIAIDAVNLSLNERETFLMFQNKRDGFVWSYDLR